MTPAGRACFLLYGLVLLGATAHGAAHLSVTHFAQALGSYAAALACLVAMMREASRAAFDEPRRDRTGQPGPWRRWRAGREARRIVRAEECTCGTAWWPYPNRPHAPWCNTRNDRSPRP